MFVDRWLYTTINSLHSSSLHTGQFFIRCELFDFVHHNPRASVFFSLKKKKDSACALSMGSYILNQSLTLRCQDQNSLRYTSQVDLLHEFVGAVPIRACSLCENLLSLYFVRVCHILIEQAPWSLCSSLSF